MIVRGNDDRFSFIDSYIEPIYTNQSEWIGLSPKISEDDLNLNR
jgi:hypothetical protein